LKYGAFILQLRRYVRVIWFQTCMREWQHAGKEWRLRNERSNVDDWKMPQRIEQQFWCSIGHKTFQSISNLFDDIILKGKNGSSISSAAHLCLKLHLKVVFFIFGRPTNFNLKMASDIKDNFLWWLKTVFIWKFNGPVGNLEIVLLNWFILNSLLKRKEAEQDWKGFQS
jgi:hypothetical protein